MSKFSVILLDVFSDLWSALNRVTFSRVTRARREERANSR